MKSQENSNTVYDILEGLTMEAKNKSQYAFSDGVFEPIK